jgi:hypothetical protein
VEKKAGRLREASAEPQEAAKVSTFIRWPIGCEGRGRIARIAANRFIHAISDESFDEGLSIGRHFDRQELVPTTREHAQETGYVDALWKRNVAPRCIMKTALERVRHSQATREEPCVLDVGVLREVLRHLHVEVSGPAAS